MSTTANIQKVLQEVAILALGRGATAAELAAMESMAGPNGDYAPLVEFANQYMSNLAATQGTANVLKTAAMNGLGMTLSESETNSLVSAIESGQMSWADAIVAGISQTNSYGQTLDNRAEAAHAFLADLASTDKSAFYSGAAVYQAVANLLQGIGASTTSLSKGISGLDALIANLQASGIRGAVVDGYVKGATVFVDANGDGVHNEGEWSTTTDDNGNYVLPAEIVGGKIFASGGTDIMTGKPFQGVLTAPAGSTVINPITTLVQSLVEQGRPVAEAKDAVQQALGLPAEINLLSYDPLAVLADSNASDAAKSEALSVQATALQVANIVSQAGAAINAASSENTLLSSANAVIAALADAMSSGAPVNLGSANTLSSIVQTAATAAGATTVATMASDLATITAASNTAAANATNITQLAQSAVVAQDAAVTAITNGVTSGSLNNATTSFTGSGLTSQINQATVGQIAPGVSIPPPTTTTPPPDSGNTGNSGSGGNTGGGGDTGGGDTGGGDTGGGDTGGGDTHNSIAGTDGDDTLVGDDLDVFLKVDYIDGGAGNDTITGGAGADVLQGGAGNDVFILTSVDDVISGETIDGGADSDTLRVNAVGQYTAGGLNLSNIETIELNQTTSTLWMLNFKVVADEDTTLTVTKGTDAILSGEVRINADGSTQKLLVAADITSGKIEIDGGAGNDTLHGGAGDDVISGKGGVDAHYGYAGNDTFTFNSMSGTIDDEIYDGGANTGVSGDTNSGKDVLRLVTSEVVNGSTVTRDMAEGTYIDLRPGTGKVSLTDIEVINTRVSSGVQGVMMNYDQRTVYDSGTQHVYGMEFQASSNDILYLTDLPSPAEGKVGSHVYVASSDSSQYNPTQVVVFDEGDKDIILNKFYFNDNHQDQLDLRNVMRDKGFVTNENSVFLSMPSSGNVIGNGIYSYNDGFESKTSAEIVALFDGHLAAGEQVLCFNQYKQAVNSSTYNYGFNIFLVDNTEGTITATSVARSSGVYGGTPGNTDPNSWTDSWFGQSPLGEGAFVIGTPLGKAAFPPVLVSSSPADDGTVAPEANLVLTFDEAVKAGTGDIVLTNAANAEDTRTIAVTDTTQVTFNESNRTMTINPTDDMQALSNYYVTMESGVVTDLSSNAFAGISDPTTLNFATSAETAPPVLQSSTPADNTLGVVAANASIVLTFNEPVKAGTGNIVFNCPTKSANTLTIPVGDPQVTFSGNTVTITPTGGLKEWNHYYVTMASGVIEDVSGNKFAGISGPGYFDNGELNFTTTGTNPYPDSMLGLIMPSNGIAAGIVFAFWDINGSGTAGDSVGDVDDKYKFSEAEAAITTFNANNDDKPNLALPYRSELEALLKDPGINPTTPDNLVNAPTGWPTVDATYQSASFAQAFTIPGGVLINTSGDYYIAVKLVGLVG